MTSAKVMQQQTHAGKSTLSSQLFSAGKSLPRFFVSTRGALVDRQLQRTAHTGYSMFEQNVTRSELQVLADLLNDHADLREAWDSGDTLCRAWHLELERRQRAAIMARHFSPEVRLVS